MDEDEDLFILSGEAAVEWPSQPVVVYNSNAYIHFNFCNLTIIFILTVRRLRRYMRVYI